MVDSSGIDEFIVHLTRSCAESGTEGSPIFLPYSARDPWDAEVRRRKYLERWPRALSETDWERTWALFAVIDIQNEQDGESRVSQGASGHPIPDQGPRTSGNRIVGHVDLHGSPLNSGLHRATLGIGVETDHRGLGAGEALMRTALDWARRQHSLEWIDLQVFAHNLPAITLYKKLGFVETGRTVDLLRVDGQRLDDVQMALGLRG